MAFLAGMLLVLVLGGTDSPPILPSRPLPRHADIHMVLSDRYLTRFVAGGIDTGLPIKLRNVRITSNPPLSLVAAGDAAVGPLALPVTLDVQPIVTRGVVRVHILSTHVAGIGVPTVISGIIEGAINDSIRTSAGRQVYVIAVTVRPQGLEVFANYT